MTSNTKVSVILFELMICIALTFFFTGTTHATGEGWPMLKNDHQRSGFSLSTSPPTNHLLWQFAPGDSIYSSPIVSDNTVLFSAEDCKLYALDLWKGTVLWDFSYDSVTCVNSHASPTVYDGKVVVGTSNGSIYGIDQLSGAQL